MSKSIGPFWIWRRQWFGARSIRGDWRGG